MPARPAWRRLWRAVFAAPILAILLPYALVRDPVMPPGTDERGPWRRVDPRDVRLLIDETAWDPGGQRRVIRQEIFDAMLDMAAGAHTLIAADFFLWNTWQGDPPETHRLLAVEWAEALAARSGASVDLLVMTDPLNRLYGDAVPAHLRMLMDRGVPVLFPDPAQWPDSNPLWSRPVRLYGSVTGRAGWLRRRANRPRLANPFDADGPPLSARQAARLLHFKANHRKVLVADTPEGRLQVLVGGLNPADSSSAHGNSALLIRGPVARDALASSLALARGALDGTYAPDAATARRIRDLASAWAEAWPPDPALPEPGPGEPRARWISEGAVAEAIEARLDGLDRGDTADVALFYLSDRGILQAIRRAADRGVRVRLLLDPNRDAFGRAKNGIPNRPAAAELMRGARRRGWDLAVRWADTHGEQFHHKAVHTGTADGSNALILGSANWTRRNLRNLNLEANLEIEHIPGVADAWRAWYEAAWNNTGGRSRSRPYEAFAESSWATAWKTALYRFQEWSGLSTF